MIALGLVGEDILSTHTSLNIHYNNCRGKSVQQDLCVYLIISILKQSHKELLILGQINKILSRKTHLLISFIYRAYLKIKK